MSHAQTKLSAVLLTCTLAALASYVTGLILVTHYEKAVADAYASGYEAGYSAGKTAVGLKEIALKDKAVTAKICNMWWFGFSTKERVLSRDKDFKDGIGQPS